MANKAVTKKMYDEVMKTLVQGFGPGYKKQGLAEVQLKAFPTGHDDLDDLLTKGTSGIARGALVEIFGSEGGGKTSLAMRIVGFAQKEDHLCCWLDAEAAFSHDLAHINGVDTQKLHLPDLYETKASKQADEGAFFNSSEILHMIYKTVCANIFGIVVLDSIAGLMPESVLANDSDPNKASIAEVARSLSKHLGKIAQACKQTETTVIFINQRRDKVGDKWALNHTPGGRALKHFAHQRIMVEKKGGPDAQVWIDEEDGARALIGHYARTKIIKNRMAPPVPPDLALEIPIYYREYIPDGAKKCYDLARKLKVITIRTGVLTWKDENKEIILQVEGEAGMLYKIRGGLEPRLAVACVEAAKGEKNQSRKGGPIKVSKSITDLATVFDSDKEEDDLVNMGSNDPDKKDALKDDSKKGKKGRSKKSIPDLDV